MNHQNLLSSATRWVQFIAVASAFCAAGFASADVVTTAGYSYSGSTTQGPTWNRPEEGAPPVALSAAATEVPYEAKLLTFTTAGNYDFLVTRGESSWDTYAFLYQGAFDPTQPLLNVLVGNDDFPAPGISGFDGVAVSTGIDYWLVVTGFAKGDNGLYTAEISYVPEVSTDVPEPASLFLVGAALFGLGAARRRSSSKS